MATALIQAWGDDPLVYFMHASAEPAPEQLPTPGGGCDDGGAAVAAVVSPPSSTSTSATASPACSALTNANEEDAVIGSSASTSSCSSSPPPAASTLPSALHDAMLQLYAPYFLPDRARAPPHRLEDLAAVIHVWGLRQHHRTRHVLEPCRGPDPPITISGFVPSTGICKRFVHLQLGVCFAAAVPVGKLLPITNWIRIYDVGRQAVIPLSFDGGNEVDVRHNPSGTQLSTDYALFVSAQVSDGLYCVELLGVVAMTVNVRDTLAAKPSNKRLCAPPADAADQPLFDVMS